MMLEAKDVTTADLESVLHFGVDCEDMRRYTGWPELAPRLAQKHPLLSDAVSRMEGLRVDLRAMEEFVRNEIERCMLYAPD